MHRKCAKAAVVGPGRIRGSTEDTQSTRAPTGAKQRHLPRHTPQMVCTRWRPHETVPTTLDQRRCRHAAALVAFAIA
jgi:hypothetical protein